MNSLNIQFLVLALSLAAVTSSAQSVLDTYIHEGMENNITLKQKGISLKQAQQSLQIARSYFLPSVSLLGDYTHGDGGRSIDLPIGDLLNPVYASLNQLTQSDEFPQVANVEQTFFPQNFYDARIRTSLPLLNTDLHQARKIQSQQVQLKAYEVAAYKRQLILEIKTSYYNYLAALSAVKIYESALALVEKNLQVNESLLRNGKSLPAGVLRSRSEVARVQAELNSSRTRVTSARKYFNFLLNRNLDSEIIVQTEFPEARSDSSASAPREELSMLRSSIEIQESGLDLYRQSRLPKLNAFLDVGTQASNWQFNQDSRYYLAGVQLSIPIFQGFRNNVQISRSRLDVQRSSLDLEQVTAQLEISADIARENLSTTLRNYVAASEQLKSARSYFNLIDKGYQQGVNSLIEYIDGRNQLTTSELQLNIRQYEMLIAAAQLEREISSFNLSN